MGERFLLTVHKGAATFMDATRRAYKADFYRFAKSPSFLLYELWDHLIENYLSVQKRFEERVERLQAELIGQVDDDVFAQVSEIGADLLHFRKILLPARSVLTDLSTRKSLFISEATQPFLANMVGTVERVLQDLLVDRDILSESLNLYMSMVSHRTNRVMNPAHGRQRDLPAADLSLRRVRHELRRAAGAALAGRLSALLGLTAATIVAGADLGYCAGTSSW